MRDINDYRHLTSTERAELVDNGCRAYNWSTVFVADGFRTETVHQVVFEGVVRLGVFNQLVVTSGGISRPSGIERAVLQDVIVGDNCLIENIGGIISRYSIGNGCYIGNVGNLWSDKCYNCGEGIIIPVLHEQGKGNVILCSPLTSQLAAFMIIYSRQAEIWKCLLKGYVEHAESVRREHNDLYFGYASIGDRSTIVNCKEIVNANISEYTEICGASRLFNVTLGGVCSGNPSDGSVLVGSDVIIEDSVLAPACSVTDGACLKGCFVDSGCTIGKGFTAENSLFFANSHMECGEACSAFCGPFSVSHHKSSLLIGVGTSFFNAGSATNFSNHAYKMGAIHWGSLQRGVKTASGCHIVLPATIGAYSVCMGKIEDHPDSSDYPFSYVIGEGRSTRIVPGRNLTTAGFFRDVRKWKKRDRRPENCRESVFNDSWLNPFVMRALYNGRDSLRKDGESTDAYDLALRMYLGAAVAYNGNSLPKLPEGMGPWVDLGGLLAPKSFFEAVAEGMFGRGTFSFLYGEEDFLLNVGDTLGGACVEYESFKWSSAYAMVLDFYDIDSLTDDDVVRISADGRKAFHEWLAAVRADARKEYALGDVDEETLNKFLSSVANADKEVEDFFDHPRSCTGF